MSNDSEAPESSSFLREARERRGLSLEDIAASTKISLSALDALERYDASGLPGGLFTRAFVRSYADEVGLDREAAVSEFLERCPQEEGEGFETHEPIEDGAFLQSGARTGGGSHLWLRLALLAVPLVALLVYLGLRAWDGAADASDAAAPDAAVSSLFERPTGVRAAGDGGRLATAAAAAATATPAGATASSPATAAPVAAPALTMSLRPSRNCWVSATVDGEVVFSGIVPAGESQTLEAREEITLNVGDAGALAYTLNDQPGRSLGATGQVVTETFTPANYRRFVTP